MSASAFLTRPSLPSNLQSNRFRHSPLRGTRSILIHLSYWRPWPKPLVPLITIAQIFQLGFVTYSWTINPGLCASAPFASAPSELPLAFATPYAMVPVYLYFFLVFFAKRFLGIGSNKKRKQK